MKPILRRTLRATFYSLLGLAVAINPLALYAETTAPAPAPKPALTVSTVTPQNDSWDISISADGVVAPWQEAVIAAEIGGLRITEVLVDVGSEVKRGQVLARLAQDTIQADIAQQQAVIAQAKAEIARAEAGVVQARAGVMQAKTGVAQAEAGIIQAQAGVAQAEAGVAQANATVNQFQANMAQAEAGVAQATASVAQAGAGVAQASATLNEAKANADRARQLKSTGALPLQQVDQYLTGEATARAGVENQKAGLSAQKAALEAQKAGVSAQKSGLQAQKSGAAARQAELKAQLALVNSRRLEVDGQEATVQVQEATVAAQQAALESQHAALKVQEAALKNHTIRLGQTEIVAADDGIISSRAAALGAVTQPGTELFRIIRQHKLEWRAEVSSNDLGQIREQQAASVTLTTGETIEGQVRLISPTLDANTRRALIYVTLPAGSSARAGMFVQGQLYQGKTDALTLPQSAVILRDGRNYVFEVAADNRVRQHEVKVGRRIKDRVEILSKLDSTAQIVATGGAFLNDNDLVQSSSAPASETTNSSDGKKP